MTQSPYRDRPLCIIEQDQFQPPYCPNSQCTYHNTYTSPTQWIKHDWQTLKTSPYRRRRFRCKACRRVYVQSIFTLDYRNRVRGISMEVFALLNYGLCGYRSAAFKGLNEKTIKHRIRQLGRQSLLFHAKLTENVTINEAIVADGLENFAFSQYDPNNVNVAVGKESYFIYDFGLCPLNRKGRMTDHQKRKKRKLEKKLGAYQRNAIRHNFKSLVARILSRQDKEATAPLELHTDYHRSYHKVVSLDLKSRKIKHLRTPSRKFRNFANSLFAVNHSDLMVRQNKSEFKRETIAFNKTHPQMAIRFAMFLVWKNYFQTVFRKKHKRDPELNILSPAQKLGIAYSIKECTRKFQERILPTQVNLSKEWQSFYELKFLYPRGSKLPLSMTI